MTNWNSLIDDNEDKDKDQSVDWNQMLDEWEADAPNREARKQEADQLQPITEEYNRRNNSIFGKVKRKAINLFGRSDNTVETDSDLLTTKADLSKVEGSAIIPKQDVTGITSQNIGISKEYNKALGQQTPKDLAPMEPMKTKTEEQLLFGVDNNQELSVRLEEQKKIAQDRLLELQAWKRQVANKPKREMVGIDIREPEEEEQFYKNFIKRANDWQEALEQEPEKSPLKRVWNGIEDFGRGIAREFQDPRTIAEKAPFTGSIVQMKRFNDWNHVLEKVEKGEKLDKHEQAVYFDYMAYVLENHTDHGIAYNAARSASQMPTYMVEFAAMGGLTTGLSKTAGEAATKETAKQTTKLAAKRIITAESAQQAANMAGVVTQLTIQGGTMAALNVPALGAKTTEYMLPSYGLVTDKESEKIIRKLGDGDSMWKGIARAYATQAVEYGMEGLGEHLPFDSMVGKVAKKTSKSMHNLFTKVFGLSDDQVDNFIAKALVGRAAEKNGIKTTGELGKFIDKYAKAMQWDGFIGENLEEEFTEMLQAPMEGRLYMPPIWTPEGNERMLTTALAIAPMAGLGALGTVTSTSKPADYRPISKEAPVEFEIQLQENVRNSKVAQNTTKRKFDTEQDQIEEILNHPDKYGEQGLNKLLEIKKSLPEDAQSLIPDLLIDSYKEDIGKTDIAENNTEETKEKVEITPRNGSVGGTNVEVPEDTTEEEPTQEQEKPPRMEMPKLDKSITIDGKTKDEAFAEIEQENKGADENVIREKQREMLGLYYDAQEAAKSKYTASRSLSEPSNKITIYKTLPTDQFTIDKNTEGKPELITNKPIETIGVHPLGRVIQGDQEVTDADKLFNLYREANKYLKQKYGITLGKNQVRYINPHDGEQWPLGWFERVYRVLHDIVSNNLTVEQISQKYDRSEGISVSPRTISIKLHRGKSVHIPFGKDMKDLKEFYKGLEEQRIVKEKESSKKKKKTKRSGKHKKNKGKQPKKQTKKKADKHAGEEVNDEVPKTRLAKTQVIDFTHENTRPLRSIEFDENDKPVIFNQKADAKITPAASPEALKRRLDNLHKFGMSKGILRREGNLRSNLGLYYPGKEKDGKMEKGQIAIKKSLLRDTNPQQYVATLAHETGHSIQQMVTGKLSHKTTGADALVEMFPGVDEKVLRGELEAVSKTLVGAARYNAKPDYYGNQEELFARFIEMLATNPELLEDIAPESFNAFGASAATSPIIQDFLDVLRDEFDKKWVTLLPDHKQILQKQLGYHVGKQVYYREIVHRTELQRIKKLVPEFVKNKFKGVKDDMTLLYQAAESIKETRNGKPVFGTRDYIDVRVPMTPEIMVWVEKGDLVPMAEAQKALNESLDYKYATDIGFGIAENSQVELKNGQPIVKMSKYRYTPEESERIFNQLSPKGQALIKEFTESVNNAETLFNREWIKGLYKIDGEIEGWVFRKRKPDRGGRSMGRTTKLKKQVAGTRFKRQSIGKITDEGNAGKYVDKLDEAISLSLMELEKEKVNNRFVKDLFAQVVKPMEGKKPDKGWVEIRGDWKSGFDQPQFRKRILIKDGKKIDTSGRRYQIPREIYERYKVVSETADEASTVQRTLEALTRFWAVNVLLSGGTTGTNFVSGGIQYASYLLNGFYLDILTPQSKMKRTRGAIIAPFLALNPRMGKDVPEWIWGGDRANYHGQWLDSSSSKGDVIDKINRGGDEYAKYGLLLFNKVETYFKRAIAVAEGAGNLDVESMTDIDREGIKELQEMEAELVGLINEQSDIFAYDYDNAPMWLEQWNRGMGKMFIPFAKYPYKYLKHMENLSLSVFDQNLSWQERTAKALTLGSMFGIAMMARGYSDRKRETPEPGSTTPARMSPRGRFLIGKDKDGNEVFLRIAKYPFFNMTEAGMEAIQGNWEESRQLMTDMIPTFGFAADPIFAAYGYKSEFDFYMTADVVAGEWVGQFIPGFRIWKDMARYLDPYRRKETTFGQAAFGQYVPVTDLELQEKLHGEKRTVPIPIEDSNKHNRTPIKRSRTTVDVDLRNYPTDILAGALAGFYITRINPDDAKAIKEREKVNAEKRKKKKK